MNIYGGGSETNLHGLKFEQDTSLEQALIDFGFSIKKNFIFAGEEKIGETYQKHKLYSLFLKERKVDWTKIISKKLLPDDTFFNIKTNTFYIIEKKFQNVAGSVDEKLQTCPFKLRQYKKLIEPLGLKVIYCYILNDWFKQSSYTDVLNFIKEENCFYFFNKLPIDFLLKR